MTIKEEISDDHVVFTGVRTLLIITFYKAECCLFVRIRLVVHFPRLFKILKNNKMSLLYLIYIISIEKKKKKKQPPKQPTV